MLKQDQAAALLARCERLLGRRLTEARGNLRKARTRATAVWELLCVDAFSQIGAVAHEPQGGSFPDIVLRGVGDSPVWIEAAYLYPRFWDNDRRARELEMGIYQEAARLKIPAVRISCRYFGDSDNPSGPIRSLPDMNQKSAVLKSEPVRAFFGAICSRPEIAHAVTLAPFTVTLEYDPNAPGPYIHGSGVVEEQPTTVEEHHLFRALNSKADQHAPDCPYIVCIGGDHSNAISSHGKPFGVTERTAVIEVLRKRTKISAVVAVSIEPTLGGSHGFRLIAHSRLYRNPWAVRPLQPAHVDALSNLDFNRWRFYFPLEKWELADDTHFHRSGGPLSMSYAANGTISMTVPSTVLVDCLAGKTSLQKEYADGPGGFPMLKCIEEGWQVIGCHFASGSIEQGQSGQVTLILAPPPEKVFGMG